MRLPKNSKTLKLSIINWSANKTQRLHMALIFQQGYAIIIVENTSRLISA